MNVNNSKNCPWGCPETEARKMYIFSPDFISAESETSSTDGVEQGLTQRPNRRGFLRQPPIDKGRHVKESRRMQDSLVQVRRSLKPGAAQTANDLQNQIMAQGRVIGSHFTLHVGWIKRGEIALRMYNRLPRPGGSHCCLKMWNWSGGPCRSWCVVTFDDYTSAVGPSWFTIPHVRGHFYGV